MWVYPLLILAASCTLAATQRDPQDDVDDLATVVRDSAQLFHRCDGANIGLFPGRGWTLTVYVGDTRRYGPGSFLVLTKVDGRLGGELMSMPAASGPMTTVALTGTTLDVYLRRAGLDLTGLDAAFVARFGRDPGARAPVTAPFIAPITAPITARTR
jgi:hypothetical protein